MGFYHSFESFNSRHHSLPRSIPNQGSLFIHGVAITNAFGKLIGSRALVACTEITARGLSFANVAKTLVIEAVSPPRVSRTAATSGTTSAVAAAPTPERPLDAEMKTEEPQSRQKVRSLLFTQRPFSPSNFIM